MHIKVAMYKVAQFVFGIFIAFFFSDVHAQNWEYLGSPGSAKDRIAIPQIIVDKQGSPYISYPDSYDSYKTHIKIYADGNWKDIVTACANCGYTAMDFNKQFYVIGYRVWVGAFVNKFYDGGWTYLGDTNCVIKSTSPYPSIAIDRKGLVYLAGTHEDIGQIGPLMLMRYDGQKWLAIGLAPVDGSAYNTSIAIDKRGKIYVVYFTTLGGHKITVRTVTDSGFVQVGQSIDGNLGENQSIAVDNEGVPYIAYTNNQIVRVAKFSGTTWDVLGATDSFYFDKGEPSIAIDELNMPYVIFTEKKHPNKGNVVVIRFNGHYWEVVGNPDFAQSNYLASPGIAKSENGPVYVSYLDVDDGFKVKVWRLGPAPIDGIDTLCTGEELTLSTASTKGTWSSSDSSIATIDTNGTVRGIRPGSVILEYTKYGYSTPFDVTINSCVDSAQSGNFGVISISPNPNTGRFTVRIPSNENREEVIIITNVMGQAIADYSVKTNTDTELGLNVACGLYFVCLRKGKQKQIVKLVIL
jgi:hypothetical protein